MTSQSDVDRNSQNHILGLLTVVISWLVYIYYICPTIYWRDSAEFVVSGYTLGVPHPAGSPTYSLISKLFTFLPVGDLAFRVNLVSAFFGTLSIYLTYRVISLLIRTIWPAEDRRIAEYSSFAGAMLFLFSATFWRFSEVAEVYSQQVFWLLLVILLLLMAGEEGTKRGKYLSLAAFFYGLSTGTHAVMGFYLPAILLYLILMDRSLFKDPKKICPLIFFLFLGLSVYLYVPVRSSADPWLDWGNPQTIKQLYYHLIDKKDASAHFELPLRKLISQLKNYGAMLPKQLSYFGLLASVIGFGAGFRNKKTWLLLFLVFFIHFAFFIRSWKGDFGFIPTFSIMSLWAGLGFHQLILFLCKRFPTADSRPGPGRARIRLLSRPAALLYFLISVTILFSAVSNRPYADKSDYYSTYRFGKSILSSVAYEGILLDQVAWFMTLYFQAVENSRPDVYVILRNAFLKPDLFYKVDNKKYPLLILPEKEKSDSPYRFMVKTIEYNLDRVPVYWYQFSNKIPAVRVAPSGIVFQILPPGREPSSGELKEGADKLFRYLETELKDPYFWKDEEGLFIYALNLTGLAMYSVDKKYFSQAELIQELAMSLHSKSYSVVNNFGIVYERMGDRDKAKEMYKKAIGIDPFESAANINLARIYHLTGNTAKAEAQLNYMLKINPWDQDANFYLGMMAWERGDMRTFMVHMLKVVERNPTNDMGEKARKELRRLRRGELKEPAEES